VLQNAVCAARTAKTTNGRLQHTADGQCSPFTRFWLREGISPGLFLAKLWGLQDGFLVWKSEITGLFQGIIRARGGHVYPLLPQ
jgi:hypothetical protein